MVLRQDLLVPAPAEGCALLLGQGHGSADSGSDDWRVQLIWPCRNMVGQREHDRFELDPREQIAAQRWARANAFLDCTWVTLVYLCPVLVSCTTNVFCILYSYIRC